jgi:hypothetical protein
MLRKVEVAGSGCDYSYRWGCDEAERYVYAFEISPGLFNYEDGGMMFLEKPVGDGRDEGGKGRGKGFGEGFGQVGEDFLFGGVSNDINEKSWEGKNVGYRCLDGQFAVSHYHDCGLGVKYRGSWRHVGEVSTISSVFLVKRQESHRKYGDRTDSDLDSGSEG